MDNQLHSTWRTIVANAASENPDLTYKIDKVANTSFDDLPTMKIQNIDDVAPVVICTDEMIDISHNNFANEIDDLAATEPMTIGGERSDSFHGETIATFADKTEEMYGNVDDHTEVDETMATVVDDHISNITVSPQVVDDFTVVDTNQDVTITDTTQDFTVTDQNNLQDETMVMPPDMVKNFASCTANNSSTLQVHKEIARGGMGVILKGKQNSLRREVAIKRLHDEDDEISKKKFVMEARVTAFLDHPNIIPIHELGMDLEGNPILTMKLVRGKSWKQLLKEEKKGTSEYIQRHLEILLRVSDALAYAHSKKIIHNDLKPSNIMVGEFGEVFLMDWGISVTLDNSEDAPTIHRTAIDTPMGTPNYMAPELANGDGEKIGPWTDVYLLGGILYFVLMGRAPHHSTNIWESISLSAEGKIPPICNDVPQELRKICETALQQDVQDRYRSVEELQDAIHKFTHHWESINITKEAQEFLDFGYEVLEQLTCGKHSVEEVRKKIPNPYCPISRALFGFDEALRIWPQNPEALKGKREGLILYGEIAICHKDFSLATRVIGDMKDSKDVERLNEKLQKTMAENHCENVSRDPWVMTTLVVIAIVSFTLGKLL